MNTIEIFKLFGSIMVDNDQANKSISQTDEKAGGLGTKLGKGVKTAALWGAAIGGAAIAGAAGMMKMATSSAETTDRIDKLSQKIGMSREGFQEWDFITSQSGMSVEQLQMGFKTLVNQVDGVISGNKKSTETFKALGVSVKDANGQVKNQETIFNEAVIALQGMEEGTEKAKLANDLFGRSGAELMPLLNGAAGSVEEMKKQAHDLGLILSDDAVDAGVQFTDTMDQLKRSFGTAVAAIGVEFMPMITKFADFIIANMPTIQAVIQTVFNVISFAISHVVGWIQTLISWLGEWTKSNESNLKQIWENFQTRFTEIWEKVKTVFENIKEIVTTVFEFVKGFIEEALSRITEFWELYGQQLVEKAITTFNTIKDTVMTVFNAIWDVIKNILDLVVPFVQKQLDKLQKFWDENGAQIMEATKNVFNFIMTYVEFVMKYIKGIFDFVMPVIIAIIKGAWAIISAIWETSIHVIMGLVKFFISLFTGDWEGMGEALLKIWTALWDGIKGILEGAWTLLSGVFGALWDNISDWFTGLKDKAVEWGKNMITGFIDGIKSMVNKVKDAVGGIIGKVGDFMGFGSPTKEGEGRNIVKWGQNMVDGFLEGVEDESARVGGIMDGIIGGMKPFGGTSLIRSGQEYGSSSNSFAPTIVNNYYQPIESPSELARKQKQQQQQVALEWGY